LKEKKDKKPKKGSKSTIGQQKPSVINPNALSLSTKSQRRPQTADEYIKGIQSGNRVILSQAITLIESTRSEDQALANIIVEAALPLAKESAIRIGITGSPGVGKSTFIEAFGKMLIAQNRKPAVLAIDPSSQQTKGSILGDKTRMHGLSQLKTAFIRPSPAGSSLGGVAKKTRETIILCEAAGFDTIIVETVGVGQSEIAVHSMVDFFLLLLLPGAGDELQGMKRGIVEMADMIAVNKSDGDRQTLAKQTKQAYKNALHLLPLKESGWSPPVLSCSALESEGIDEIWTAIGQYYQESQSNGFLQARRKEQARYWLNESIDHYLHQSFFENPAVKGAFDQIEKNLMAGQITSFEAARQLITIFKHKKDN